MEEKTTEVIDNLLKELVSVMSILTWRIKYETNKESVLALIQTKNVYETAVNSLKTILKGGK